jgi:hypothetical protein
MQKSSKQIVIVESSPTDMMAKTSYVLRKNGYKTILITLTGDLEKENLKKSYDKLIGFDFKFFKLNAKNFPSITNYAIKKSPKILNAISEIRKLNPCLTIGRSNPNWLCYLTKKYFKKSAFIYFPYDIRSFCYDNKKQAIMSGVPNFELYSEKYCFENADGIIHKGADHELEILNKNILGNLNLRCPIIHFLPYCLNNFQVPINKNKLSKKDKETHLVFVGHIGIEDSWINSVKMVLDQKIHLHLYGKTANLDKKQSNEKEQYTSLRKNKYLHLEGSVSQELLAKEISKYDYGIWLGYYDIQRPSITTCNGNKLASHLEAGIPTIYFKNHKFIGKLCDKYKIGFGVELKDPLNKILKKQNYKKLEKNILKARKDYEMHNQIPRLIKFFDQVIKYKRQKQNKR